MLDRLMTLLAPRRDRLSIGTGSSSSASDPMKHAWLAEDLGLARDQAVRIGEAMRLGRRAEGEGSPAVAEPLAASDGTAGSVRDIAAVHARGSAPFLVARAQAAPAPENPSYYGRPVAAGSRRG